MGVEGQSSASTGLDVADSDQLTWLKTLAGPEHAERRDSLHRMAALVAADSPNPVAGDARFLSIEHASRLAQHVGLDTAHIVAGPGHTALTTVITMARLRSAAPRVKRVSAIRRPAPGIRPRSPSRASTSLTSR